MIKKAFTLIEILIYIAVVSFLFLALIQFAWNVIGTSSKSVAQQEVASQIRYVTEKIKYEIRNSKGINAGSSNFDVNLAGNSLLQLSLVSTAPNDPVVINVLNGKIQIKKGASAAIQINSADTTVQNLTFTSYSSVDGKTINIGFNFTLVSTSGSGRHEFSDSTSLRTAVEIRSN